MSQTKIRRRSGLTFTVLTLVLCSALTTAAWQLRREPPTDIGSTDRSIPDSPDSSERSGPGEGRTAPPAQNPTPTAPPAAPEEVPAADDPLLLLINKTHPLPADYSVETTALHDYPQSVATVLYDDLCQMLAAGRQEGLSFMICSGYRSTAEQAQLFDEDLAALLAQGLSYEQAYEETARFTMPPGCSEHESGLAVDIVSLDYQMLDETQASTAESQWLRAHCWEYGFILRYPDDRSALTGISYESWHYRYVGRAAAAYLTAHNLTLEEFHALNESALP